MTLFDALKAEIADEWQAYVRHPFVEQLGDGTLPLAAFQDYLVQDYLFLIQFARANALAAYQSRGLADIRRAADALEAILAETALHVRLTESWGIGREQLEAAPEKLATVAYTRYVLDCGQAGGLLDLEVALAPCAIGYGEIGARLAPRLAEHPEHPYRDWIHEYAAEEFQQTSRAASDHLDTLTGGTLPDRRFQELVTVFRAATRLETAFWQQALDDLGS
ncbi:thiaminase II [Brachybacterium sacelli]|uniref:Aminopyrimidine aminohydrolase n=1 Tax=Brachybacterium sacelli TaxID=173364 RepID=A0ABS4WYJ8_9MICO|nr:thiaminase II [Brachybacterium sacelli]MBP2381280.1 thiaminase/transcriptional activator TenA [Brachybacterium sacelli]